MAGEQTLLDAEAWGRDASASAAVLTAADREIVDRVDTFLARGLALKRWWERARRDQDFERRFELAFTYNRPDVSYGFFGRAPVEGAELPVLGNFQTQFYDQPKSPVDDRSASARFLDRQLRQFVLRYFMRVSDFREPQPFTRDTPRPPWFLQPFSMCPSVEPVLQGFGYSQLYYKLRSDGRVGRFPAAGSSAIVDLREIGPKFEWIVVKVKIFDFSFSYQPFGPDGPSFTLPLAEDSLLVLTRDFILDERSPRRGELGHYGLGYAFLKNPAPSILGWGPGEFDAAFQTIDFRVLADGRIRVDMVFVANRPTRILKLPFDPLSLGCGVADLLTGGMAAPLTSSVRSLAPRSPLASFEVDPVFAALRMANLMTGGLAARELCISREQLEKDLILKHFSQHYSTITGSLQTWRQIRNWLDEASLPRWVVTGESV